MTDIASIDGVADVVELHGAQAVGDRFDLIVEVPHGADRRSHFDTLRAQLRGDLPPDLHDFFHANTDVGAWQYGRRVAEQLVERDPLRSALLIRCLVPRTFIDCNRVAEAQDEIASGGLTAGLAPYIRDPDDRALLLGLHDAYLALVERAFDRVCGGGGFALLPHTYGPRSMGIERVDDNIAAALRAASEPATWETWPERPEVDLIASDEDGIERTPPGMVSALVDGYREIGLTAVADETYYLHPSTQARRWIDRYPEQVLCLEVRRDLVTIDFDLFHEQVIDESGVARVATPLVHGVDSWLRDRNR